MSTPAPARHWRTAVGRAITAMTVVGAAVSLSPETIQSQSGPTRTVMEIECRAGGHEIRSLVVDVMNRRIIPTTGTKGRGCLASAPFQWPSGRMPDLVGPDGKEFRSTWDMRRIVFERSSIQEMYEVFGPAGPMAPADSARVASGGLEPGDVWQVLELGPARRSDRNQLALARQLEPAEARQFMRQLQLYLRVQQNVAPASTSSYDNSVLGTIRRNAERQVRQQAEYEARRVVSDVLRKVF